MYLKLIIGLLLFYINTGSSLSSWEEFKRDYNKEYASTEEENHRREIFSENINRINEYKKIHSNVKFTIGINHLTDHRIEELISTSKLFDNSRSNVFQESFQTKSIIPTRFDWRYERVITPVRNQSVMDSPPAIVAAEVIESYRAIETGNLTRASVDQIHQCCGNALEIFDCISNKLHGRICSEDAYSSSNGSCIIDACEPYIVINNIKKLDTVEETKMLDWIQESTLYIAVDASQIPFQTYQNGIFNDPTCSKTQVNHVLQLVGYGFQSGIPYWLCKNSWGETWGEQGYIRIERGRNTCGIASYVVQIESTPTNHAKGLWNFNYGYLAIFYIFLYIFKNF